MADNRRELHLVVRDAGGRRVLVAPGDPPVVPVRTVELAPAQSSVSAAVAALRDQLDIRAPLLEVHFDYAHGDAPGPVPALVVTERRRRPEPPAGLAWHDIDAGDPGTTPGLRPRLAELLAEWRAGTGPPPLRPRWARDGWHARATAWLTDRLTELGRPPTGETEQLRHWGISALLRTGTADGAAWFKAVFPPFHHEPAVTRLLADAFPGLLPEVLAIEPAEGWLVTADLGSRTAADAGAAARRAAVIALVELQRAMTDRTDELVALGCPRRPIATLANEIGTLLANRAEFPEVQLSDEAAARLVDRVSAAVDGVGSSGIADTLVHGDFHTGNVAAPDDRVVLFDWSDAAVSHPLVDVATWIERDWTDDDKAAAWASFVDAWSGGAPAGALEPLLEEVITVGAAYQAISYAGIARNLEPLRRPEMADGVAAFLSVAAKGLAPDPAV